MKAVLNEGALLIQNAHAELTAIADGRIATVKALQNSVSIS